jgi:Na+-transporting methylmalonyl-CoA/oxaloacetate decarboxylase gamma subunit
MKRIISLGMALVMIVLFLGGCFIEFEDRDWDEKHEKGERHERSGEHEERH